MNAQLSGTTFDWVFGLAPFVIGIAIYLVFYVAKRDETGDPGKPIGQTYACAGCGRRGHRDHMVPQEHGGAVSWYCAHCATAHAHA